MKHLFFPFLFAVRSHAGASLHDVSVYLLVGTNTEYMICKEVDHFCFFNMRRHIILVLSALAVGAAAGPRYANTNGAQEDYASMGQGAATSMQQVSLDLDRRA